MPQRRWPISEVLIFLAASAAGAITFVLYLWLTYGADAAMDVGPLALVGVAFAAIPIAVCLVGGLIEPRSSWPLIAGFVVAGVIAAAFGAVAARPSSDGADQMAFSMLIPYGVTTGLTLAGLTVIRSRRR